MPAFAGMTAVMLIKCQRRLASRVHSKKSIVNELKSYKKFDNTCLPLLHFNQEVWTCYVSLPLSRLGGWPGRLFL